MTLSHSEVQVTNLNRNSMAQSLTKNAAGLCSRLDKDCCSRACEASRFTGMLGAARRRRRRLTRPRPGPGREPAAAVRVRVRLCQRRARSGFGPALVNCREPKSLRPAKAARRSRGRVRFHGPIRGAMTLRMEPRSLLFVLLSSCLLCFCLVVLTNQKSKQTSR